MEDVSPKEPSARPEYLGDGVYATFDGYQVWIYTSDGLNTSPPIALDPDTLQSLNLYYSRMVRS